MEVKLTELETRLSFCEGLLNVQRVMNNEFLNQALQKYSEQLGGNPEGFQEVVNGMKVEAEKKYMQLQKHGKKSKKKNVLSGGRETTESGIVVN